MNIRTALTCFTLMAIYNIADAQVILVPSPNYGERYQRRRSAPQQETINEAPKGYVSVNSGFSSVLGNWGFGFNTQYDGSYAMNGTFQNIAAGIPINGSNFGVALMLGFYDNPFDYNTFVGNALYASTTNYTAYSIPSYGDYQSVNLMAGVFYTYPLKRFSFDARAMLGYISCGLPGLEYDAVQQPNVYINPTYQDDWQISSSTARGVAYDVGVGIRYSFRRNTCIMLNADFLQASLPFSTTVLQQHIDQNGNVTYSEYSLTGTVPLSLFNISLGLGIQFGR